MCYFLDDQIVELNGLVNVTNFRKIILRFRDEHQKIAASPHKSYVNNREIFSKRLRQNLADRGHHKIF